MIPQALGLKHWTYSPVLNHNTAISDTSTHPQRAAFEWWSVAFEGQATPGDTKERACRVLEEAIELAQAESVDANFVHHLVKMVYSFPSGNPLQELGGVYMATLIYAQCKGTWAVFQGNQEILRVIGKYLENPDHFKARHQKKIDLGMSSSLLEDVNMGIRPAVDSGTLQYDSPCPICRKIGMRQVSYLGRIMYKCINHECASNGGTVCLYRAPGAPEPDVGSGQAEIVQPGAAQSQDAQPQRGSDPSLWCRACYGAGTRGFSANCESCKGTGLGLPPADVPPGPHVKVVSDRILAEAAGIVREILGPGGGMRCDENLVDMLKTLQCQLKARKQR